MTFRSQVPDSEFDLDFVEGMKDRMAVSFFKYGPLAKVFPKKVNAQLTLIDCLAQYKIDHNTEHLIDLANYAMIEFMHPSYDDAHFTPTDSEGSVGRVDERSKRSTQANNDEIGVDPTTLRMRKKQS